MKDEMILVIQEYNGQRSNVKGCVNYALNLLQEYLQMAKAAVAAAGMPVDFSRMEQQVESLHNMRELIMTEEELHSLIEKLEDILQRRNSAAEMQNATKEIREKVSGIQAKDAELQNLLKIVLDFDESLRFDEVYVDIMEYVKRMPGKYNEYQMASGMMQGMLLQLCDEVENFLEIDI